MGLAMVSQWESICACELWQMRVVTRCSVSTLTPFLQAHTSHPCTCSQESSSFVFASPCGFVSIGIVCQAELELFVTGFSFFQMLS